MLRAFQAGIKLEGTTEAEEYEALTRDLIFFIKEGIGRVANLVQREEKKKVHSENKNEC